MVVIKKKKWLVITWILWGGQYACSPQCKHQVLNKKEACTKVAMLLVVIRHLSED
jgi:hypothetical protein